MTDLSTGEDGDREGKPSLVKCGDCTYFARDGSCGFLASPEGRDPKREFAHAPFWVWSDCYSDREQVRRNATSACPTFSRAVTPSTASGNKSLSEDGGE